MMKYDTYEEKYNNFYIDKYADPVLRCNDCYSKDKYENVDKEYIKSFVTHKEELFFDCEEYPYKKNHEVWGGFNPGKPRAPWVRPDHTYLKNGLTQADWDMAAQGIGAPVDADYDFGSRSEDARGGVNHNHVVEAFENLEIVVNVLSDGHRIGATGFYQRIGKNYIRYGEIQAVAQFKARYGDRMDVKILICSNDGTAGWIDWTELGYGLYAPDSENDPAMIELCKKLDRIAAE